MSIASINRQQALELFEFCKKHELTEFFFAKDHGVYLGATVGSIKAGNFQRSIHYLEGMSPDKVESNVDLFELMGRKFGYDDFGVRIPVQWLDVFFNSEEHDNKDVFSIQISPKAVSLRL